MHEKIQVMVMNFAEKLFMKTEVLKDGIPYTSQRWWKVSIPSAPSVVVSIENIVSLSALKCLGLRGLGSKQLLVFFLCNRPNLKRSNTSGVGVSSLPDMRTVFQSMMD